ncbi:MAG: hypothetical protein ACFB21_05520 [Opitutales bacterium]
MRLGRLLLSLIVCTCFSGPFAFAQDSAWEAEELKVGTYFPGSIIPAKAVGQASNLVVQGTFPVKVRHLFGLWDGQIVEGTGRSFEIASDRAANFRGVSRVVLEFRAPNVVDTSGTATFFGAGWSLPAARSDDPLEPNGARWILGLAGATEGSDRLFRFIYGNHLGEDANSIGPEFSLRPRHWYRLEYEIVVNWQAPAEIRSLSLHDLGVEKDKAPQEVVSLAAPVSIDIRQVSRVLGVDRAHDILMGAITRQVPESLQLGRFERTFTAIAPDTGQSTRPEGTAGSADEASDQAASTSGGGIVIPIVAAVVVLAAVGVAIPLMKRMKSTGGKAGAQTSRPEPKPVPARRHPSDLKPRSGASQKPTPPERAKPKAPPPKPLAPPPKPND